MWVGQIREFAERDRPALEALFSELQEFERKIDANRIVADTIAAPYIDWILSQCDERAGRIFLAETHDDVVGFLCVWLEPTLSGMISRIRDVAFISDIVVLKRYRRQGVGTALLARAEAYAASVGVPYLVVGVLAGNEGARQAYFRSGFTDYDLRLVKQVDPRSDPP